MKNINIFLVFAAFLTFTSCSSFLEEYSQDEDYIRSWEDLDELLIGDCYVQLNKTTSFSGFGNKGMFLHLLADELNENNVGSASGDVAGDYHPYTFGAATWQPRLGMKETYTDYYPENRTWKEFYKKINIANNIITSAQKIPQNTNEQIEGYHKVLGEALFVRAFLYFWLTNVWGQPYNPSTAATDLGVPLKTTEEIQDVIFERQSVKTCYEQILSDLLEAEQQLSKVTKQRKSIYRADITSVQLLLARVYLFMQNWEQAAIYAQKVVKAHPALEDLHSPSGVFMSYDNPENIFSMGGDDVYKMVAFMYQGERISRDLYDTYSKKDLRRSQWYWTYQNFVGGIRREDMYPDHDSKPTDYSYHTWHYWQLAASNYSPVSSLFWLRSSEAYLILAEAQAYMGKEDEARSVLQTFANNRYQEDSEEATVNESGSELITRIRNEHRREFPLEGHRWFDLRRYRVCEVQPEKISITHSYTIYRNTSSGNIIESREFILTEDDASWTCPIPHEVVEYNTGMPGNGNQDRPYTVINTPQ